MAEQRTTQRRPYQPPVLQQRGAIAVHTHAVGFGTGDHNGAGKNDPSGGPNSPGWSG